MRTLLLGVCLALGVGLAALGVQPPTPLAASAPADAFSAARAFEDIRAIAVAPHPVGSAAHDAVKAYLVQRFAAMGLAPTAFDDIGVLTNGRGAARMAPVSDIIAVLHGTDPTLPAVAVMSHYDSVTHSPGAADDSAGVAAALEIARALKAGQPPKRDVVFLITDGEELGLLGAQAFFAHHPLAKHIGMVINFEARGDAGLTAMFETGANNADLIALYAEHARYPSATSLAGAIYNSMPNGSDFSIAKKAGIGGLNFAFIADESAYHSPLATPEHLSLGSVQHMGDQALPVVRALAMAETLPAASKDAVYADLFSLVLIHYPPWAGWVLLLLTAGLIAYGFRAGGARFTLATARGLGGAVLTALTPVLLAWPAGSLFGGFDHFQRVPHFPALYAGALLLTFAVVAFTVFALHRGKGRIALTVAAVLLAVFANLLVLEPVSPILAVLIVALSWLCIGKMLTRADLWQGALALGFILALALQIAMPAATPTILWPLLLAAIVFAAAQGRPQGRTFVFLGGAVAVVVVGWLGGLGDFLFEAMGVTFPWLFAAPLLAALPVLLPLLAAAAEEKALPILAGVLLALGVGCVLFARFAPPGEARPMPSQVMFVQDLDTGKAWRVAGFRMLDPWAAAALGEGGTPQMTAIPGYERKLWATPVKPAALAHTQLRLTRDGGRVRIEAVASPGAYALELSLRSSAPLKDGMLGGGKTAGEIAADTWSNVAFYAPDRPLVWSFAAPAHAKIEVVAKETQARWPEGVAALPAMPKTMMPMTASGFSQGVTKKTFAW